MDDPLVTRISPRAKVLSALFYGVVSFLIIIINKVVLTTYGFPSPHFLGVGQMIITITLIWALRQAGIIDFPNISLATCAKIFPLPIFFGANLVCGLGGTQKISLPMFTALRRFSILMTMIGEYLVLRKRPQTGVVISVFAMVGGAMIAACKDLSFDVGGYTLVLLNDFFTAANIICVRKVVDAKDLTNYELLFYNALLMVAPLCFLSWAIGDLTMALEFPRWLEPGFLGAFLCSCLMGFMIMYATVLCTAYNSALTTTIIGCLKNIMTTYVGMYVGGDYIFNLSNFVGLNISVGGSLLYSYLTFIQKQSNQQMPTTQSKKRSLTRS
uniref:Udp glucuronic acid/udp n acetylgalactosamine transporter n=1 Tax=Rhipicephalus zambeziensis TaxID=60191 RepID=A0A224Z7N4_9ACAR